MLWMFPWQPKLLCGCRTFCNVGWNMMWRNRLPFKWTHRRFREWATFTYIQHNLHRLLLHAISFLSISLPIPCTPFQLSSLPPMPFPINSVSCLSLSLIYPPFVYSFHFLFLHTVSLPTNIASCVLPFFISRFPFLSCLPICSHTRKRGGRWDGHTVRTMQQINIA